MSEAELVPFGQPPAIAFTYIELSELVALLLLFVQTSGLLLVVANAAGTKRKNPNVSIVSTATNINLAMDSQCSH